MLGGLGWRSCSIGTFAGSGFFRSVFLFPYALSFITTGVAWRLDLQSGDRRQPADQCDRHQRRPGCLGVGPLKPGWITDPTVVWQLNRPIAAVYPPAGEWSLKLGVPVAMIPVAIAAAWQLSGFAMAMFLAGLGTISHEVREAAALDGASDYRLYKDVIIPLLNPITVSVLIILTHVSLKIFDLVFAMSARTRFRHRRPGHLRLRDDLPRPALQLRRGGGDCHARRRVARDRAVPGAPAEVALNGYDLSPQPPGYSPRKRAASGASSSSRC